MSSRRAPHETPSAATGLLSPPTRSLPLHLNSVALIFGRIAAMGLGFLSWLVAARLFDPEEVGLASGAVSAMMLCVQLALFGAGAAVILLFPRYQHRPADLLDSSIGVVTLSSLVSGGLFLALASGIFQELSVVAANPNYAVAFLAMCVFGTLGLLFEQISTALRRGDQVLVRGALSGLMTLVIVGGLPNVAGWTSSLSILVAWVAAGVVTVAVGFGHMRQSLPGYRFRPRIRYRLAKQLVAIGLPNWALTLTERAPGLIMPIIVTEMLSPEINATWYAVWMMAWVVLMIPIQVGMALFAEAAHRPSELGTATRHGVALSLAIGVTAAAGAAILGPFMLSFLGHSYAVAGETPLRILVLTVFPFVFIQAYFSACRSRHRLTEAILTAAISGGAGVGAAAAVAANHGLPGMAVAWLVIQMMTGTWALVRLRRMLGTRHTEPGAIEVAAASEVRRRDAIASDSAAPV